MEETINKVFELQNKIFQLMNNNNGVSTHFRYDKNELSLITYNKTNSEFFLVKSFIASGSKSFEQELGLYEKMYDYISKLLKSTNKTKINEIGGNSYTVVWKKNNDEIKTSYFYGDDMEDVMKKFYYGKEGIKHMFNIFEIKLNPIS